MTSAVAKCVLRSEGEALSELTSSILTTSLGLLSSHPLISLSQSDSRPASRRSQEEWQRWYSPLERWTWPDRSLTPADNCTEEL